MVRLKLWQWVVLALPIAIITTFLIVSAGMQIHRWGISWIWGIFTLVFAGLRWLVVRWTEPALKHVEAVMAELKDELQSATGKTVEIDTTKQAEILLHEILKAAQNDPPIWEDWQTFWTRCQDLVTVIAHVYYPEIKYPLLNIYVPQAYGLIRGTVDDLDRWMQKLSPALNQVTVGQAYQAYEVYRKLEPSARKIWQAWNWAQWLFNPVAAMAKQATKGYTNRATQQLLVNLAQLLRENALRNLCRQAMALYSSSKLPVSAVTISTAKPPSPKTENLREILAQAEPVEEVVQKPINILVVGRTGSGKSSLINTLFQADIAEVDVLPSTGQIQNYHWQTSTGETLTLWDTPGYEQVNGGDLANLVLGYANNADLLLLVTPALDPSLQMDVSFIQDIQGQVGELPTIAVVTQVDLLRPMREWQPPYDWQWGDRPKEIAIRKATQYRAELLDPFCKNILPIVTSDIKTGRDVWGIEALSLQLIEAITPAKQLRLARFLRNIEARTAASAKIIDHYTFQMATTQGITALLKSPVLQFISTLSTGSPTLAYLLAEKIPVEQLPIVIGKLQMAYDLFSLLDTGNVKQLNFDLLSLWPLLLENSATADRNAWAFGNAIVEYWTQGLSVEKLRERFNYYLKAV
ncbi:GTPase family protein [Umezakia ovalisporum]|uniref:GTPase family protein n=1 Tax=Umezakia ovalisporum FSS-43 TaxID=2740520 RepID=A0ABT6JZR0_9CYAN|nr:GTPase family protein [Umezakia ovalisporum]MDH6055588.1 GTPase family protein [Umezakia ovalisporum FSS-43]MDH6065830.1 GTPase family protein [Umezakia ovalisporum APH033B]MDH6069684.1 GTPase family protein [Umezakia ovalisporum CobakiLakeA]MDH6076024.1 GTPase family protein [Umezakia ovalisporum CS-1034]MDH6080730.1 GTPase family protein [Umezakia ovalisporum FSS-44]